MRLPLSNSRKDQRSETSLSFASLALVKEEGDREEEEEEDGDQNEKDKNDLQKAEQNETNNLLETNLCARSDRTNLNGNKSDEKTQVCSDHFGKRILPFHTLN